MGLQAAHLYIRKVMRLDYCFIVLKGSLRIRHWKKQIHPLSESDSLSTTVSLKNKLPPRHAHKTAYRDTFALVLWHT